MEGKKQKLANIPIEFIGLGSAILPTGHA